MTYVHFIAFHKRTFKIWGAGDSEEEAKQNALSNLSDQEPNAQVSDDELGTWRTTRSLWRHGREGCCPCPTTHWDVKKDEEDGWDYADLKIDEGDDDPDGGPRRPVVMG